jgi:hypothetical protein
MQSFGLAKGLFLGIDPAGYKVLDLQSKVAYVARTVKIFDSKRTFPKTRNRLY